MLGSALTGPPASLLDAEDLGHPREDLLRGPERKVSLFSGHMDEDGHVWMPPLPTAVGDLPPGYHFNVSDEDLDWERDDGGFASVGFDQVELFGSRCRGAPIGQIDDLALAGAFDRRARFLDKTLQPLR